MRLILQNAKPVSVFLTILMLSLNIPYQPVLAAMVGTETFMEAVRGKQVRDEINNLILREDVQSALKAQGINPIEAKARIDSLSDAEVIRIADQIDKIPAGGIGVDSSAFVLPTIIGCAVFILIVIFIVYLATND
jgi:hypothetical protein